ncbi:metallophosphoesterase [Patescibacteria group bacterium]
MKIHIMVVFIVIILVILVAGHYGLFSFWVYYFGIDSLVVKKILGICLGVLSVSFIASTLLVHWKDNFITSNLYYVSSLWLGVLWSIVLATVITSIVIGIANVFSSNVPMPLLASIFLGLALVYSICGFWNAWQPQVKNISIQIKNLPTEWQGRKAVHVSDIHLGAIHHRNFMDKVVTMINEIQPEIVFITGDLFDGAGKKLSHLADSLDDIKAPLGIYYITGNHETYISLDNSLAAVAATKTKILRDEIVEVEGVQVAGIDYPLSGMSKDIKPILTKLDQTKPTIAMYHEPKYIDIFKEYGVNLLLSGHTHKGQVWPFNYITSAIYKGYDYGQHKTGDLNVYTTNGVGTWGPPMRTFNRPEIVSITFSK